MVDVAGMNMEAPAPSASFGGTSLNFDSNNTMFMQQAPMAQQQQQQQQMGMPLNNQMAMGGQPMPMGGQPMPMPMGVQPMPMANTTPWPMNGPPG